MTDEADAKLQDCFAGTDWNMFRDSSDGIEEFTTSVTSFINKCIDNIIPTVTVRTYRNRKPWITGNIRTKLKARATALDLIRNPAMPNPFRWITRTRIQSLRRPAGKFLH